MKNKLELTELPNFVKDFLQNLEAKETATIIGLYGNLGAGKTTFTKEVARQLGVESEVTSPTFTILQNYKIESSGFENLIHIDLYRIEDFEETKILKLEELFKDSKNLIMIEWIEKIDEKLDVDLIKINFEYADEESRVINING